MKSQKKLKKLTRDARNGLTKIKLRRNKSRGKQFDTILQALNYFCTRTTLHGLRNVVDPELHVIERFLWFFMFVVSSTVASNVIYSLALRYQSAPTSIGIESMQYENSNLPFPSVTLCPNDRVDWARALDLEPRIFPNDTDEKSLETFRKILGTLSMMSFGDFDNLDFLKNQSVHNLAGRTLYFLLTKIIKIIILAHAYVAFLSLELKSNHYWTGINITQVLYEVMPRCDQLLSACWWRNANRNCCEIFQVQKTEYGFCYSFNSELAQIALVNSTESRPRKASGYGDWSGVKVTIHLGNITKPPNSEKIDGVVVIINEPRVWPNSGTMIPSGSLVSTSLVCVSGYATQGVLELDEDKQPCLYDETGMYNQETCLSLCKRSWVIKFCGCNPSFYFPATTNFRDCTIKDFACLVDHNGERAPQIRNFTYNVIIFCECILCFCETLAMVTQDVFNDYIVHFGEEYPHDIPSMICNCMPECDYYVYSTQFSNVPLHNMNDIILDVHYIGQTSFRYKTDIVITQMDLLVSFGGIIGLFLGGSLLSAVELVYYLVMAVFSSLRSRERTEERPKNRSSVTHVRTTVLPILDYNPLKPQAKRIPIFANYGLAELNLNRY
ncbi:pickpocket protein 19 [Monomorium pharaonis]|uniref:pickpocket protein 19 n=1 Tax=Monomorium pharaonis TaxID=307658 RepID=UPI0017478E96|nr:pickpocket protein 19 [Monomorium pharaonis]